MDRIISVSTIKAKIKRLNVKGEATKLYDEADIYVRNVIESSIVLLNNNENFIFCYYLNTNYWWVITNFRLLISKDGFVDSFTFDNIKSVEVKDIFELGVTNKECKRIQLILNNGDEKDLELESNTWFSILNLFKFLQYNDKI